MRHQPPVRARTSLFFPKRDVYDVDEVATPQQREVAELAHEQRQSKLRLEVATESMVDLEVQVVRLQGMLVDLREDHEKLMAENVSLKTALNDPTMNVSVSLSEPEGSQDCPLAGDKLEAT